MTENLHNTPLEGRIEMAIGLFDQIPLESQVEVINRAHSYVERLSKKRYHQEEARKIAQSACTIVPELVSRGVESNNLNVLQRLTTVIPSLVKDYTQRKELQQKIAGAYESSGYETRQWRQLAQAGEYYLEMRYNEDARRIANKLERLGTEEDDWQTLSASARIFRDINLFENAVEIAKQIEKTGRQEDDSGALISAARLYTLTEETFEKGIRMLIENGRLAEAKKRYQKSNWQIPSELRSRFKGLGALYNRDEILSGKGYAEDQAQAYLEIGQPMRAINSLLSRSSFRSQENVRWVKAIMEEHNLEDEVTTYLRETEPTQGVYQAILMEMPVELIRELATKARFCSETQIDRLKQERELLNVEANTYEEGEERRTELKQQVAEIDQKILAAHLSRNNRYNDKRAALWAEEIGDEIQANVIRERMLAEAIEDGDSNTAINLAREMGRPEIIYQSYLNEENFTSAFNLAVHHRWIDRVINLILTLSDELKEVKHSRGLESALELLSESIRPSSEQEEAINIVQNRLWEQSISNGNFAKTAKLAEERGLLDKAAVYRGLEDLIPRPASQGRCYVTTACCEIMGLSDNCQILTNLRNLRDNYIAQTEDGPEEICKYYLTASKLLKKIPPEKLKELFAKIIKPASDLVEQGRLQEAYQLYKQTIQQLIAQYLDN